MKIRTNEFSGDCSCGMSHAVSTELLLIESGCMTRFAQILLEYGITGKIVGLFDTNTIEIYKFPKSLFGQQIVLSAQKLHADEFAVTKVLNELDRDATAIVAFGSGTIHDIARYCAKQKNLTFVSCPTAASVDGFCSSVCATTFSGVKVTVSAVAPKIVIADLDIIQKAPIHLVKSGIGDIIGKYIALCDWKISHILTNEPYCEKIAGLMANAVDTVVALGTPFTEWNQDFYEKIMVALLLSGLAMQLNGSSRPASGAEHHLSHLISIAPKPLAFQSDAMHGESVGVGTVIMAETYHQAIANIQFIRKMKKIASSQTEFLRNNFGEIAEVIADENQNDALKQVDLATLQNKWVSVCETIAKVPTAESLIALFHQFGLKTTLQDIGIDDSMKDTLVKLCPYMRNRLTFARLLWVIE